MQSTEVANVEYLEALHDQGAWELAKRVAALEAERDARAAHVERLREATEFCNEHHHFGGWTELLDHDAATSLARRDLIKQAEILERLPKGAWLTLEDAIECVDDFARELRQQAKQIGGDS